MTEGTINAPWTDEQVDALNRYQRAGYFHEFTCGKDQCRAALVAQADGWACPRCDYRQDWAHAFMAVPPTCSCSGEDLIETDDEHLWYCLRGKWDAAGETKP